MTVRYLNPLHHYKRTPAELRAMSDRDLRILYADNFDAQSRGGWIEEDWTLLWQMADLIEREYSSRDDDGTRLNLRGR